jgi:glycosyltransferase involved in cell wall biosynthesis
MKPVQRSANSAAAPVTSIDRAAEPGSVRGRVLYAGHAYYNAWYLSRELRKLGWKADVLNWDANEASQIHYHGEDFRLDHDAPLPALRHLGRYLRWIGQYDIFHFSNTHGIRFSNPLHDAVARYLRPGDEIRLLKRLGKRVVYSNNGCLDGVSQTSFASWGATPVCDDCPWRHVPSICSDEGNLAWGAFRNSVADYQILVGGNHIDFNLDPRVHEVPEFYCLDEEVWHPRLEVPDAFRLPLPERTVKIYHAVGDATARSEAGTMRNLKSSHIYFPLIEQLKSEGFDVDLMFYDSVPNRDLRYYQVQADIVVDMLTYGFFGATAREAMMLGKPVVCYLRPEWLESMRAEIPGYVDELPVISATPDTIREVLIDLIEHPDKRAEIGRRSREFAVKWHSSRVAGRRFDAIYSGLLAGDPDPGKRV